MRGGVPWPYLFLSSQFHHQIIFHHLASSFHHCFLSPVIIIRYPTTTSDPSARCRSGTTLHQSSSRKGHLLRTSTFSSQSFGFSLTSGSFFTAPAALSTHLCTTTHLQSVLIPPRMQLFPRAEPPLPLVPVPLPLALQIFLALSLLVVLLPRLEPLVVYLP